ncbi:MAG: hypothetical protein AB8U56_03445 [Rickettsia aeschlimannii]
MDTVVKPRYDTGHVF